MKSFIKSLSGLLLLAGLSACSNPNWDEHYASHVDQTLETTLLEAIEQEPSLSSFLTLLKETGQDKILSYNQSFTVWAPNNAALSGVTFETDYDKEVFVLNHISRFPYTTTSIDNGYTKIRLMDRKRAAFTQVGSDFYFGENKLISKDASMKNGILHVIDGYEPYVRNIWEFIQSTPGYDSIAQYLAEGEERYFSVEQSTLLTLVDGLAIYDSVFVESNPRLISIGQIKNEDSIYTMIVPNNEAWTEIMDSLMPYNHVSPYITQRLPNGKYVQTKRPASEQDSMERYHIRTLITDRLCFFGTQTPERIQSATALELSGDGGYITNPAEYFAGMKDTTASNGLVYMASQLHLPSTLWCSPFQEEAESAWLTYPSNYNTMEPEQQAEADTLVDARSVYVRSSEGTSWLNEQISNHRYIQVTGNYASARPVVDFNCYNPAQRSTSYHVYVVFLPRNLNRRDMDSAMLLPTKVTFSISYTNPEDGTPFVQEYRTPRTTNPYGIDTMCVTLDAVGNPRPITLPYSRDDVTLRVSSAVGSSEELKSFITDMYIDAIFFEPVKNE